MTCGTLAVGFFNLACTSPFVRSVLAVGGWAGLAWSARRHLHWGILAVDIALDLLLEPRARSLVREGWMIDQENIRRENAFQRAFDANTAAIRTDPRPDARPGPPGESEEAALARNLIESCEDKECPVCASALTPDNLTVLTCCVPRRVQGAVGHVLCGPCWARVPGAFKRCPQCRRVAKACAPAEMVSRIRA